MTGGLRKLVFFVMLIGITYAAYQFMIKPANANLTAQKKQLDTKLAKLEEFERATAKADDLNDQIIKLEEAVNFFESKLPPKSQIYNVLEQVTLIAQEKGLKPKTIRTMKEKNNSGYIEQPLKMELVGNFGSFYSFLLELEKLPRIMKIRDLNLQGKTANDNEISADFVLSIFFQNKIG